MGKPSAPPAPDYAAAARQQGTENIAAARTQARLNTPNTYTPYGSQTVSFGAPKVDQAGYDQAMQNYQNQQGQQDQYGNYGAAPDISQFTTAGDSDTPTITQTLNPESQAALEAQQRIGRRLSQTAENYAVPTLEGALRTPFDPSGYDIQTSLGPQMPVNYGPAMGQYGMAGSVAPGAYGQAGSVGAGQYGMAQGVDAGQFGGLKTGADMSGVARMPVNAGMTGQQAIMNRLQPQLAQQSAATAQQLANQGITPGSEAYNNAMREQQQSQNDLLSQAALQGIGLDMSANQQGYGQAMGQAGLFNQALGQGFGQAAQARQMGNQAIGQNFGQGMSSQQLLNQAIGQNYGQAMSSQDQANAAMAQNYGQAGTSAGLYNQAAAQQYNQNLGAAQFGNQAQQQRLQQNLAMRNQPLNEIMGLLSGSQIQTPQFQAYQGGGNIQAAPVAQAATNQGNYNTAAYNAKMQALGGLYSGIGSIVGGAASTGTGGIAGFSDIRLKSNIVKVGDHPKGFGIYEYDIFGRRERGVMAQEVEKIIPEAVLEHPSGYKMVNYGAL
jgi:hypothetical protein